MGTLHCLRGLADSGSRCLDGSLESPSSVSLSFIFDDFLVKATRVVALSRFVVETSFFYVIYIMYILAGILS